jgi:hypothetical protein
MEAFINVGMLQGAESLVMKAYRLLDLQTHS